MNAVSEEWHCCGVTGEQGTDYKILNGQWDSSSSIYL
jgi:hypothetical protein